MELNQLHVPLYLQQNVHYRVIFMIAARAAFNYMSMSISITLPTTKRNPSSRSRLPQNTPLTPISLVNHPTHKHTPNAMNANIAFIAKPPHSIYSTDPNSTDQHYDVASPSPTYKTSPRPSPCAPQYTTSPRPSPRGTPRTSYPTPFDSVPTPRVWGTPSQWAR